MKKYIFILGMISFLHFQIQAEDLPEITDLAEMTSERRVTPDIENKEKKVSFNVLPYVKFSYLGPGIGVCGRTRANHFGLEYNVAMFSPNGQIFANELSISILFYTAKRSSFYSGIGVGGYIVSEHFIRTIPVFFGYEGQKGFIDLGAIVIAPPGEDEYFPIPNLRVGFRF